MTNLKQLPGEESSFGSGHELTRRILEDLMAPFSIGLAVTDSGGKILEINSALEKSLGYGPRQLNGSNILALTPPKDLVETTKYYTDLISGKISSYTLRKEYLHKKGYTVPVNVSVYGLERENQELRLLVLATFLFLPFRNSQDVISLNLIQNIADNIMLGILAFDREGKIPYANRNAEEILDRNFSEENPSNIRDLLSPRDFQSLQFRDAESSFMDLDITFLNRHGLPVPVQSRVFRDQLFYDHFNTCSFLIFRKNTSSDGGSFLEKETLLELHGLVRTLKTSLDDREEQRSTGIFPPEAGPSSLTGREMEILTLLQSRKTAKEIALSLGLAEITIRKHLTSVYRKFGVSGREDLLLFLAAKNSI